MALGGTGGIFNMLGRLVITAMTSYFGYTMITNLGYYTDRVSSPLEVSIVFVLVSYSVASLFMSVFGMASETIIQCFIMDEEDDERINKLAPAPLLEFVRHNR